MHGSRARNRYRTAGPFAPRSSRVPIVQPKDACCVDCCKVGVVMQVFCLWGERFGRNAVLWSEQGKSVPIGASCRWKADQSEEKVLARVGLVLRRRDIGPWYDLRVLV
jgi:hypothetical protein